MINTKHYIETGGCKCPRCSSYDIEGDAISIDQGIASQSVWCVKCGLSWTDEYDLVGVRALYDLNTDLDVPHNLQQSS